MGAGGVLGARFLLAVVVEAGTFLRRDPYSRSTGAVGWSYSFGLEHAANTFALANCARRARDCEVIVSFHDTCAALAVGGGVVARAWTASQSRAEDGAKAECVNKGGQSCEI